MSIDSEAQPEPIKRPDTETHTQATSLNLRRLKRSFAMATNQHGGSSEDTSAPNACRRHSDLLHARQTQVDR